MGTSSYGFSYAYNFAGGLISQGYPSSLSVSLGYDGAGRLSSVGSYASNFAYAPHGGATEMQLGNGQWEHTLFNNRLQASTIGLGGQTDSSLLQLSFDYGLNVNNTSTGLFQRAVTPVAQSAFNAATNRIVGNGYDAAGNQTGAGGGGFTFDAESRMISVTLNPPQSGTFDYVYDGDGRRVKKTVYGMNSVYVYNAAGQLAAEYRDGALFKEFIYAGGRMLAMEDPIRGTSYVTADHLGSTRVVTDSTGAVRSRHDYLPFGKEIDMGLGNRSTVAGYGTPERVLQRFTGKELDPETGLEYFIARYYSGAQGRFTTPDEFPGGIVDPFTGQQVSQPGPLPYADINDPQTLHKYAYVRNSPLRYTDPDGHCTVGTVPCQLLKVPIPPPAAAPIVGLGIAAPAVAVVGILADVAIVAAEAYFTVQANQHDEEGLRQQDKLIHRENEQNAKKEPEPQTDSSGGMKKGGRGGKPDIRATKPEKNTLDGSIDQYEGISRAQDKLRKVGRGTKIESKDKSRQRMRNQLRKIKSLDDVKEEKR